MSLIIRESKVDDSEFVYRLLLNIATLHREARPDVFEGLVSKYTLPEVQNRLSKPDNGVLVAEIDETVVGYVFCEIIKEGSGNTLYIDDLCVDPEYRSNGIGKMLLDAAKEYATAKSCSCVMLNVWEFNTGAISFYEKNGFETRSRHMEIKL